MSADSDKTEEPTEHKLQEERKKGTVMKSQDVISTAGLIAAIGVMYGTASFMYNNIKDFWLTTWERIGQKMPENDLVTRSFFYDTIDIIGVVSLTLAPLLVACFIMGIVANVAQIKLLFTVEPLKPSLKKINPISGFKQIFSMKSVMELVKQLLKLAVVGWIVYSVISGELEQFKLAPSWDIMDTVGLVGELTMRIVKNVLLWL